MEYTLMHKNVAVLDIDLDESRKSAILSAFSSPFRNLMTPSEVQCPTGDSEQDAQQDIAQVYEIRMDM